jgi:hypothetical protein
MPGLKRNIKRDRYHQSKYKMKMPNVSMNGSLPSKGRAGERSWHLA